MQSATLTDDYFRNIVATAADAIITADSCGTIVYWNAAAEALFGYPAAEVRGRSLRVLLPEWLWPEHARVFSRDQARETCFKEPRLIASVCRRRSGEDFPAEISVACWLNGGESCYSAIIRDVSAQCQAVRKLQRTTKYLDTIIASSLDAIVLSDGTGHIIRANRSFIQLVGVALADMAGSTTMMFAPPACGDYSCCTGETVSIGRDFYDDIEQRMQELFAAGKISTWETYVLSASGMLVPVEENVVLLHDEQKAVIGAVGIIRDITERRRSEVALKRTQFAVDNAGDMIIWVGEDARMQYVNNSACARLGYSRAELLNMTVADIDPRGAGRRWPELWAELQRRTCVALHSFHRRKDGTRFPVDITASHVTYAGREYVCAFIRDSSERRYARRVLRESEERFRVIVESSPDAIMLVDAAGSILVWNAGAEKIFGYAEAEIITLPVSTIIPSSDRERDQQAFVRLPALRAAVDSGILYEGKGLRKNGAIFPAEVSYSRWKTRQATYYLAIVRDITERTHAEQRLKLFSTTMLAAREEEKRRLSMNLHDELGALAVTLGGHLCSIRDGLRNAGADELLQELERLTGCFKAGIGRLRTIAVDLRPPALDVVGLPAALQAICASARKSGGMHVEAEIMLHQATLSENASIALYRVVQEAFNNIVRHSGAQRARLSVVGRTTAVQCRVHDNGIGFAVQPAAPECRQATLGLLGMRERIELLGGTFHIESSPGCGTDISFTLPAAAFP